MLIDTAQSLESPQLRTQLVSFASNLQSAIRMIHPEKFADTSYQQKKKEDFSTILKNLHEEHQRIQARKVEIERRKELHEQQLKLLALKEEEERRKRQQELEEIERERQRLSALERERIKKQREDDEKREKERQMLAAIMREKAPVDSGIFEKLEHIDPEEFVRKRIEQHEKEEMEKARRLAKLEKRFNWIERVIRLEEAPLIAQAHQKQIEEDKKYDVEYKLKMEKEHHLKWEHDLAQKQRLSRMISDKQRFEATIMHARNEEFNKLKKERDEKVAAKRAKILEERERRRKEEAERQSELERQRQQKEEEERKKRETEEKRRNEEAEQQRRMQERADIQRKREEEALAKMEQMKRKSAVPEER